MEQFSANHRHGDTGTDATRGHGAARKVSRGIMQALERGQIVPGQRLVETDLAAQYGVGRNAVREAVQWLSAHNVIDATRHRSAAIRHYDRAEALEILDIAEAFLSLAARTAAQRFAREAHRALLKAALAELEGADEAAMPGALGRAHRHFHNALITIGGGRALARLFPALGVHVLQAQYRLPQLGRIDDFRAMAAAVAANDMHRAEEAVRAHVAHLRSAIAG